MSSCNELGILILALFSILINTTQSSPCSESFFQMTQKRNIKLTHCYKLTTLGAEFGWNYHNESRLDIIFGIRLDFDMGWVAWGVNPNEKQQMVGTRAFIGIKQPNGSLIINKYNVTSETKLGCQLRPSKIDVGVEKMRFEYSAGTQYFTIHATLVLSSLYDVSRLNHVWQVGYDAEGNEPRMHPTSLQNVDSTQTIDLKSGSSRSVGQHRRHLRMVHGILNIVGWGTLLPIGVIIARYLREFPVHLQWWFCFHVSCQIVGYILGTTGWVIGIWLGHVSEHYSFRTHRLLAIFIFTFTTLQMLALRIKPSKNDKYRRYWNIYHHFLGYALMAVIATNIFHGISILRPNNSTWRRAYVGILVLLAFIVVAFEIFTWAKFFARKAQKEGTPTRPNSSQPSK